MHEAAIAKGLLESALAALPQGKVKIVKMVVSAGILAGVEKESLSMYLSVLGKGTPAENAALDLQVIPAKIICRSCGAWVEYDGAAPIEVTCRKCGGPNGLDGGRDPIVLETLEVEQNED